MTIEKPNYTCPPTLNSVMFALLATLSLTVQADYLSSFSNNDHYTYLDHFFGLSPILMI